MELEESTFLTSDYTTKLQSSRQYGTGVLFFGRFFITASILVFVIGLFIFSISSWFSLED